MSISLLFYIVIVYKVFMRIEFNGGDYDVYLTEEDVHFVGDMQVSKDQTRYWFNHLVAPVENTNPPETMIVMGTRDATTLSDPKHTHNGIYFGRNREEMTEEEIEEYGGNGIMVQVYPPVLAKALETGVVGTRYDGYSDKITFRIVDDD